jgi:hypothetical protein
VQADIQFCGRVVAERVNHNPEAEVEEFDEGCRGASAGPDAV